MPHTAPSPLWIILLNSHIKSNDYPYLHTEKMKLEMVSNIHKVAEEIKPNLADAIAHVLTHKTMLTFIYFLKHLFILVVSIPKCLFKPWHL